MHRFRILGIYVLVVAVVLVSAIASVAVLRTTVTDAP
jgi:hypothetical protein